MDTPYGVGVLVIKNGLILCGIRGDNYKLCGPGGHIMAGEKLIDAAVRETQEEFRIKPASLSSLGIVSSSNKEFKPSVVYLCTQYEGEIETDGIEMLDWAFGNIYDLMKNKNLHPAYRASLEMLMDMVTGSREDGGAGSGNWGHAGVHGQRGGSAPGGGNWARANINGTYVSKTNRKGQEEKLGKAMKSVLGNSSVQTSGLVEAVSIMKKGGSISFSMTDAQGVQHKDTITIKSTDGKDVVFDWTREGATVFKGADATTLEVAQIMHNSYGKAVGNESYDCKVEFNKEPPKPKTPKQKKALEEEGLDSERYSQERKDKATWNETKKEIHKSFVEEEGKTWNSATEEEKIAIRNYTGSHYIDMNDALYSGTYKTGKVDIDTKIDIDNATSYLNKCRLPHDTWVERGCGGSGYKALGLDNDLVNKAISGDEAARAEVELLILGKTRVQEGFLSSSPKKGEGWGGQVVLNGFLPEGSHASYAEPYSKHGGFKSPGMSWDERRDGKDYNPTDFGEFEVIVQRSCSTLFTKISYEGSTMYVDCDIYTPDV